MVGPRNGGAAPRLRRSSLSIRRTFARFAAVDWSGQAIARPRGIAVAVAAPGTGAPTLLAPALPWSRQDVCDWLLNHARAGTDLIVGLDLSPALPFADCAAYFPGWAASPGDAHALWALVDRLSAADPHLGCEGVLQHPEVARYFRQHGGRLGDRFGERGGGRLRTCEQVQQAMRLSPSSCFNLVGAAQVGKSSLTGMRVLHRLRGRIPVWPFDPMPASGPVVVEIYTTIAARAAGLPAGRSKMRGPDALDTALCALGSDRHAPLARYDDHATDALLTAAWLRGVAHQPELWSPAGLTPDLARTEGWTFGAS